MSENLTKNVDNDIKEELKQIPAKKVDKKMKPSFFTTIKFYYTKHWKMASLIIGLIILNVICSIMIPLLTFQMTTDITRELTIKQMLQIDPNYVWVDNGAIPYWGINWQWILLIAIGVLVVNVIMLYISQYTAALLGKKIEIDLRDKSLEALVRQDISYYSDKKIGELLTKVISDTQIVGDQASQVPVSIITAILQIFAALVMCFVFDWQLTIVALIAFLLILVVMGFSFAVTKKRYTAVREVITDINGDVTDRISTVRLIKSTGTENYETKRFEKVHEKYYEKSITMARVQSFMGTVIFGGITLLQFSTIGAAMIFHSNDDGLTFFQTTFSAFNLAQGVLISPLFQIVLAAVGIAQASVAATRIMDTIDAPSILNPHYHDGIEIESIDGDIIFKDVEFAYPEKPGNVILPKFNFKFEKGKSYAFVGETGAGKSTISKLLLRFYDPSQGNILINNNVNLKDVHLSSYLEHVGYVEQEPQILFGDVFENVRYGKFGATDKQVIEACKKAELHDLVMTWPDKYKTILGERGFMLSGGQKQRLVIARMFLKDPQLLILDEATSALDNIVEKEIQVKLEQLMKGRTTVSIAHRLSTIKNVDQVIVLGPGKGIVQIGTFNELKNKPGHFQRLYKAGLMD